MFGMGGSVPRQSLIIIAESIKKTDVNCSHTFMPDGLVFWRVVDYPEEVLRLPQLFDIDYSPFRSNLFYCNSGIKFFIEISKNQLLKFRKLENLG